MPAGPPLGGVVKGPQVYRINYRYLQSECHYEVLIKFQRPLKYVFAFHVSSANAHNHQQMNADITQEIITVIGQRPQALSDREFASGLALQRMSNTLSQGREARSKAMHDAYWDGVARGEYRVRHSMSVDKDWMHLDPRMMFNLRDGIQDPFAVAMERTAATTVAVGLGGTLLLKAGLVYDVGWLAAPSEAALSALDRMAVTPIRHGKTFFSASASRGSAASEAGFATRDTLFMITSTSALAGAITYTISQSNKSGGRSVPPLYHPSQNSAPVASGGMPDPEDFDTLTAQFRDLSPTARNARWTSARQGSDTVG